MTTSTTEKAQAPKRVVMTSTPSRVCVDEQWATGQELPVIDYPDFLPAWYVAYDWGMYDVSLNDINKALSPYNIVFSNFFVSGAGGFSGMFWHSPIGSEDLIAGNHTLWFDSKKEVLEYVLLLMEEDVMKLFDAVGAKVFPYLSGKMFKKDEKRTYTIKDWRVENVQTKSGKEDKLVLLLEEEPKRPFIVSNKTNTGRLFELYGEELDDYKGKALVLVMKEEKHGPEVHKCLRVDVSETQKVTRAQENKRKNEAKKPAVTKSTKKKSPFLTWWDSLTGEQQTAGKGQVLDALSTHPRYIGGLHPVDDISVCIDGGLQSIPVVKNGKDTDNIKACVCIYDIVASYADMRHNGMSKFEAMTALQDAGSFTSLNHEWIAAVTADYEDMTSASKENITNGQASLFPEEVGGSNNNAQLI